MTLFGGRIPNEGYDGWQAETVITFPQKQYNDLAATTFGPLEDYIMVPGFGAQRVQAVAANDNFPLATHVAAGYTQDSAGNVRPLAPFGGTSAGYVDSGQYIGLTRRQGDFMATYTGRQYWPIDPRPEEVFIEDIAHALSLQCRYAGHALQFYSVAEHSVHIARWLRAKYGPLMALHGLLHDATEAFCVDVPRPLKPSLTNYREIENKNWLAISQRFGLSRELPAEVHEADNRIIGDEIVNMRTMAWHARYNEPLGVRIGCWPPAVAEQEFLWAFEALVRDTDSVRRAA